MAVATGVYVWTVAIVLGILLNYVGILKRIDWLKEEKTEHIFPGRSMLPVKEGTQTGA